MLPDIKDVYGLLTANKPYVGLNSRYTYFLLAKDFSDTCLVAEHDNKIIGFSSGYIPPSRPNTFFSWEAVVHKDYRGHGLQVQMFLCQIKMTNARYFEGTVNPSNEASKNNLLKLTKILNSNVKEKFCSAKKILKMMGTKTKSSTRLVQLRILKESTRK